MSLPDYQEAAKEAIDLIIKRLGKDNHKKIELSLTFILSYYALKMSDTLNESPLTTVARIQEQARIFLKAAIRGPRHD